MLFYSPSLVPAGLRTAEQSASRDQVAQVDLVPTLALLLGLPVPFGSVGFPLLELLSPPASYPGYPGSHQEYQQRAAQLAARQLLTYAETLGLLDDPDHHAALSTLRSTEGIMGLSTAECSRLSQAVAQQLRQRWTTFDVPRMAAGCFLLGLISVATLCWLWPSGAGRSVWSWAAVEHVVLLLGCVVVCVAPFSDNMTLASDKLTWISCVSYLFASATRREGQRYLTMAAMLLAPLLHQPRPDAPSWLGNVFDIVPPAVAACTSLVGGVVIARSTAPRAWQQLSGAHELQISLALLILFWLLDEQHGLFP